MKTWTLSRRSFARANIAALAGLTLPRLTFGEPVYDTQDRPRWQMHPDVEVPYGGDILTAGVKVLRTKRSEKG